jgi:hypothetical protein
MSTATTTSTETGQHTASRSTTLPTNTPTTQLERSAAQRLRTTMAAVRLAFTWLRVRKTLAPEQRTTAARAFHADRELLSASKLILDTKNPTYRAVAAVRSEASSYWRTVTLPFPEAGIRLLPQNSLGIFANTMQTYRERLQEAARKLAGQYDTIKSGAQRRRFRPPSTRASGGRIWSRQAGRCWGLLGAGRRRERAERGFSARMT